MKKHVLILFTMPNCPRCPKAKKVCEEVAKKLGLEFREVNIEQEMEEALMYQVTAAPSIALDDETLFFEKAPTLEKLMKEIKKHLG
jgi:glutaredoxin